MNLGRVPPLVGVDLGGYRYDAGHGWRQASARENAALWLTATVDREGVTLLVDVCQPRGQLAVQLGGVRAYGALSLLSVRLVDYLRGRASLPSSRCLALTMRGAFEAGVKAAFVEFTGP